MRDRLETSASPGKRVRGGDVVTTERIPGKRRNLPVSWEDNAITPRVCLLPLLPPALYAEHKAVQYRIIPLVSWDQVSCLCSLPVHCLTSTPLSVVQEAEKALAVCEVCSAVTQTSLNYQHCFQHRFKTQPLTCYNEENYTSQKQQT